MGGATDHKVDCRPRPHNYRLDIHPRCFKKNTNDAMPLSENPNTIENQKAVARQRMKAGGRSAC